MASGPDFKSGLYDTLPTANVDIAPTVARILNLSMPDIQGRVLEEALQGGPPPTEYVVLNKTHRSSTKTGLTMKLPTDLDGRTIDPILTRYSVELKTKILTRSGATYTYFDQATAVRELISPPRIREVEHELVRAMRGEYSHWLPARTKPGTPDETGRSCRATRDARRCDPIAPTGCSPPESVSAFGVVVSKTDG